VRQVLADALAHELKDPRIGFVTVTDVTTSPDLRHARVYVSVLGEASQREQTLDGLRSAHGYLQRRIAVELNLKHTPTLEFSYDETTDKAMRVGELIDTVGRTTPSADVDASAAAGDDRNGDDSGVRRS
jgi:ribosome-binding factor A